MTNIEKKLADFITKYYWVLVVLFGFIGGLAVRRAGLPLESDDWKDYLMPWMQTLIENTGFKALCMDFYNYYIPYMTILAAGSYLDPSKWLLYIKVISIVFEVLFAVAAALISLELLKDSKQDIRWAAVVFAVFMISPMIVLDGAFWGQCDYIYSAFAMFGVYFFLKDKYILSMNMFGLAYAFKQQTLILLPVILLVWICNKKFSLWKLVFIPMWFYIGGLPAIIAGRAPSEVYSIYKNQAYQFGQLSMNLPNIYRFFPNFNKDEFFMWGMVATALIFAALGAWVLYNKYVLSKRAILALCLCSTGICGMFLPALHERYLSLYAGFAYLYYLIYSKKKVVIAGIIDVLVCITYFFVLYDVDNLSKYQEFATVHLLLLCYIIYDATKVIKEENIKLQSVEE